MFGRGELIERDGVRGGGGGVVGDVIDVVEEDGAANAVIAAAYSRIGEAVLVPVTIVAACASLSRERGVPFNVLLWYGHGA